MAEFGIVGEISIDHIITSQDRVYDGILGGPAPYAAAGARLWADSVSIVSRVGTDLPPPLLEPVQDHGIETDAVHRFPYIKTRRTFAAYDAPSRLAEGPPSRHYLRLGLALPKDLLATQPLTASSASNGAQPLPSDLPQDLSSFRAVHLAFLEWESASLISRSLRQARVPMIAFEPADQLMRPERLHQLSVLLRDVDAFLPSRAQVQALFRSQRSSVWEMAEALGAMGPTVVLIKDPLRGLWLYEVQTDRRWSIPVYPNSVVDVTGADSTLCGGFLVGLGNQGEPLQAALQAAVASSFAVEGTGPCYPLTAMPGLAQARLQSLLQTTRRG